MTHFFSTNCSLRVEEYSAKSAQSATFSQTRSMATARYIIDSRIFRLLLGTACILSLYTLHKPTSTTVERDRSRLIDCVLVGFFAFELCLNYLAALNKRQYCRSLAFIVDLVVLIATGVMLIPQLYYGQSYNSLALLQIVRYYKLVHVLPGWKKPIVWRVWDCCGSLCVAILHTLPL